MCCDYSGLTTTHFKARDDMNVGHVIAVTELFTKGVFGFTSEERTAVWKLLEDGRIEGSMPGLYLSS